MVAAVPSATIPLIPQLPEAGDESTREHRAREQCSQLNSYHASATEINAPSL